MKRTEVIRAIIELGAEFVREGSRHTIYKTRTGNALAVPRHAEIKEPLARKIIRDAGH